MTTAYKPPVTTPTFEPLALAFLADLWGVEVTTSDQIPRVQCEWCAEVDALTTMRIHGDPNPTETTSSPVVDVCVHCAERAVREAHAHQQDGSKRPIRVEIGPMPAGWTRTT